MAYIPWCFDQPHIVLYVFWYLIIMLCIGTTFLNIIGLKYSNDLSSQINTTLSRLYIIISVVFIVSTITYVIHTGKSLFCSDLKSWTQTGLIGIDLYLAGLAMLYLLYVFRLKITFHNSKYSLSMLLFTLCLIGFIIQFILILFATLYLMRNDISVGLKLYSIFNATNFTFNVILLILFTQKIYTVSKHSKLKTINKSIYNKQQKKSMKTTINMLLKPTVRNIICAFISLIGSNIVSILGIIRSVIIENEIMRMLHILLIVFDIFINSYCIFLQFSFGDKQYKLLCNKLDKFIFQKMQKEIVDVNINSEHKNDSDNTCKIVKSTTANTVTTSIPNDLPELVRDDITAMDVKSI